MGSWTLCLFNQSCIIFIFISIFSNGRFFLRLSMPQIKSYWCYKNNWTLMEMYSRFYKKRQKGLNLKALKKFPFSFCFRRRRISSYWVTTQALQEDPDNFLAEIARAVLTEGFFLFFSVEVSMFFDCRFLSSLPLLDQSGGYGGFNSPTWHLVIRVPL